MNKPGYKERQNINLGCYVYRLPWLQVKYEQFRDFGYILTFPLIIHKVRWNIKDYMATNFYYNKLHTFNAVNEEHTRNDRQVKICYKLPSIHKLQVLSQKSSLFFFISAPEPKAQVHYCDHALSVVRRPSVRPSVVNFSHFRLLLWNRWMEFNETWQEARSQRPLPSLCFLGRLEKQDGRPGLWLAETFSTSPLKLLNGIQRNLTGSKISTSSTKFVFFGPIGKTRRPPWPLIGWDIFDFSSETIEWNSTKLDRKQDLNVLYQVCVFQADRKNKMAALASDWLRHFRLLLWNRLIEFNKTS